jgi:hypothetical protein
MRRLKQSRTACRIAASLQGRSHEQGDVTELRLNDDPHARAVSQALADSARIVGDGDLGIIDIRMPKPFPFETVDPLVNTYLRSPPLPIESFRWGWRIQGPNW